jgi:hypothetical protein
MPIILSLFLQTFNSMLDIYIQIKISSIRNQKWLWVKEKENY